MRRTVLRIVALAAALASTGVSDAADRVRLGDAEVGFRLHLGRMRLAGFDTSAEEMDALSVVTNGATVTATWKGHPALGEDFTVTASFVRQEAGWTYSFGWTDLDAGRFLVETVSFPDLVVPRTETSGVLHSRAHGMGVIRRPDWKAWGREREPFVEGPLREFQFIALLDEGTTSWYVDARDSAAAVKRGYAYCRLGLDDPKARLGIQSTLPAVPALTRDFTLPWTGVIAPFKGGWFEATQLYRPWARQQPWFRRAVVRQATPQAKRLRDVCLWAWNRGRTEEVVPPVLRFAEESGLACALHWDWWHRHPKDVGYPDYWPPADGVAAFAEAIARLKAKGVFTMVYLNGMCADQDGAAWADVGAGEARLAHDGTLPGHHWNVQMPDLHRLVPICGEGVRFQRRLAETVDRLAAAGLNAVYLDQVSCCVGVPCWNRAHRHPPGDGRGDLEGARRFVGELRAAHPAMAFGSEEVSEQFLGDFDTFISLFGTSAERCNVGTLPEFETVPAWNAVYHGTAACFGTYSLLDGVAPWDDRWPDGKRWKASDEKDWHALFPDQFFVEFARTVAWGNQPSVHALRTHHLTDAEFAAEHRFMLETVRFYAANRDFLFDGEMRAPGTLVCATQKVDFMRRGIYSSAGQYGVSTQDALPTVFHNVWRNADGATVAILVNWSGRPQRFNLTCPDGSSAGEIPARSWKAIALHEHENRFSGGRDDR